MTYMYISRISSNFICKFYIVELSASLLVGHENQKVGANREAALFINLLSVD